MIHFSIMYVIIICIKEKDIMKNQPIHCIFLKIAWILSLIGSIGGVIWFFSIITIERDNGSFIPLMISMILFGVGTCLVFGIFKKAFEPELENMKMKKDLYIQDKTKHMQEELASTDADIHHRSIKKRARSVKQGLNIENCPKCGDKVDANENFCSKCGYSIFTKCNKCNTVNESTDAFCRICGNKLKEQ